MEKQKTDRVDHHHTLPQGQNKTEKTIEKQKHNKVKKLENKNVKKQKLSVAPLGFRTNGIGYLFHAIDSLLKFRLLGFLWSLKNDNVDFVW